MNVSALIASLDELISVTAPDTSVKRLTSDSRTIEKGDLFAAIKGTGMDGHSFISQAIEKGASAILCEDLPENRDSTVSWIQVKDSASALAIIAATFYGNPSKTLQIIGVTGTNGKTTTATLLYQCFMAAGYNVGLLSTVENRIKEEIIPSTHTTPDPIQLQELLSRMLRARCTHVFMEVSSHALVQKRVFGIQFSGAIFTNISHDHLDYHGTFLEYIRAKKILFDTLSPSAFALINSDDKRGFFMVQNCKARKLSYGIHTFGDYHAQILSSGVEGMLLRINDQELWTPMTGAFNVSNLLAVFGTAIELGLTSEELLPILSVLKGASGRMDHWISPQNVSYYVDYAHTPDALENVLKTLEEIKGDAPSLITLVGCGGNRDRTKRPKMANIALKYSSYVIFTSDNPRFENPEDIWDDMKAEIPMGLDRRYCWISNRKEAIEKAVQLATTDSIVLIAGKGHETYQEIEGIKYPFDDRDVVKQAVKDFYSVTNN